MSLKQTIRENKAVLLFLGKAIGLYMIFLILEFRFFEPGGVNRWITNVLSSSSTEVLQWFGFPATNNARNIFINGEKQLFISTACNGFSFMYLFTAFVLAYPARWKHKAWFLPAGILLIHLLNTLRVIGLILNWFFHRQSFDFNHKYTYVVFVYGILLFLWVKWAGKYALTR